MLYCMTATAVFSARLYTEDSCDQTSRQVVDIHYGVSVFPGETYRPLRSWGESQGVSVGRTGWSPTPPVSGRGGDFACVHHLSLIWLPTLQARSEASCAVSDSVPVPICGSSDQPCTDAAALPTARASATGPFPPTDTLNCLDMALCQSPILLGHNLRRRRSAVDEGCT